MKKNILLLVSFLIIGFAKAQTPVTEAAFVPAFKQIIADSYKDFKTVKGEKFAIAKDSFACKIQLPGSEPNYISTYGLSSFHARYTITDKKNAIVLYNQVLQWTKKCYLPNRVGLQQDSSYNVSSTKFYVLTANGMENWRTSISLVYNIKDKNYRIAIYLSGISKRVFAYANKSNAIKDDVQKSSVTKLFKAAINSNWEDITDTAIIAQESLPFEPPFGMNDGTYQLSTLQLATGKSYIYKEGSSIIFLHLTPLSNKEAEAKKQQAQWIGKLCYAVPSHYVIEKKDKKEDFLFMMFYPTKNYEIGSYEGIEIELDTVAANGDSGVEQYIVTQFKLHNSSTIKL